MVGKGYFAVFISGVKKSYKAFQKLEEIFPYIWEGSELTESFNDSAQTAYLLMGGDPIYDNKYNEFESEFWNMLTSEELPSKGFKSWGDFYDYWKERITHEV